MSILEGRDENVLWLMFKAAKLINEFEHEGKHICAYRYVDGKHYVNFVVTDSKYVKVQQPGVCLFDKVFQTNTSKTKWERI